MSRDVGFSHDGATRGRWLLGVGVFASLALHVWSLMRFPAPFVDEAWLTNRAWAFIQTGRQLGPLDMGLVERFEGAWTANQWLITFLYSLSLRLYGSPMLVATRAVSLAFGLVLLAAVYSIANRIGPKSFAWLSVFLVSVSLPFIYSSHLARYDIVSAAFGFTAIAFYLERRGFWTGLVSGFCVGLAVETHLYSVIFVPVILALYFWDDRWLTFRRIDFWGWVAGGAAGALYYAALHLLPYPQTYAAISRLAFDTSRTPPILTFDWQEMVNAVIGMGWLLVAMYHLLLVVIVVAVVVLLKRRAQQDQRLLVSSAVLVLAHIFVVRNKFAFYAILVTPALDMLTASFLFDFFRRPWPRKWRDYAASILVGGLVAGAIVINWSFVSTDGSQVYQAAQNKINQAVRPGDSIMGAQVYWFGLQGHKYYSWELLLLYQNYAPGTTLADAFNEFRPDVFVIDGHLSRMIADLDPQSETYRKHVKIARAELETFLSRHARLVSTFDGGSYGDIHVYRINWKE